MVFHPLWLLLASSSCFSTINNNSNSMSAAATTTARKAVVNVKIVSDIVWPFCYVGLRNLQIASTQSNVPIHLEWEPFLLNPNLPDEGEPILDHLQKKYGASATQRFGDPNSHLMQAGRKVGIQFTNDRNIYPTVKAHVLMEELKKIDNDKANTMMEDLYKKYFEEGQNINNDEFLTELSNTYNIHPQPESILHDKSRQQNVFAKDRQYKNSGIHGVPYFMIGNDNKSGGPATTTSFSGAYPPEMLADVLKEKANEEEE